MFTCYLMPLLQIGTDASRDQMCTSMEEITHALVDLKEHFDELDSAITYQVRPPKILRYSTVRDKVELHESPFRAHRPL